MRMFWEFFSFELRLRRKSISTYIYFGLWFVFAFLCVASESFGPVANSNGKVLLNGPYATSVYNTGISLFGIIIIAAIFGTSILRDFQRDTYQMLFTKPISKFAYLGGRWAGSLVVTIFAFSGAIFGEFAGTFAPWADHTRIGPNHFWWYLQPFLSITVVQIFFLGSLFFAVAALSRKIFVVYVQGAAVFMVYLIGLTVFQRRARWSASGLAYSIRSGLSCWTTSPATGPWSRGILFCSAGRRKWSGVFLYNRLLWLSVGCISLVTVLWALFPMSVEALTAVSQGRRAAKAKQQEEQELRPVRSLVAATPAAGSSESSPASTTWAQFLSLSLAPYYYHPARDSFLGHLGLMTALALSNGYFAGRVAEVDVWPVTYLMLQAVEGGAVSFLLHRCCPIRGRTHLARTRYPLRRHPR